LNKKYRKNIEKQKGIQEKIEELKLKQEMLKEEQVEMENIEVLKEYRSIDISIDEFLEMMRNYKKEEKEEKRKLQEMTHTKNHNNMVFQPVSNLLFENLFPLFRTEYQHSWQDILLRYLIIHLIQHKTAQ